MNRYIDALKKSVNYTSLFLAIIPILFTAWSLGDKELTTWLFARVSYYVVLIAFCSWVYVLCEGQDLTAKNFWSWIKGNKFGIGAAVLITVSTVLSVESFYRVLADETNLLAVSKSFKFLRTMHNITTGFYHYGNFHTKTVAIEKRPLLYPLILSFVHSLTGYRYENTFYLNNVLLSVFMTQIFFLVKRLSSFPVAIAAMFAVASQPIVIMIATSGGFDLLNACFFVGMIYGLILCLERPTAKRLAVLWMTIHLLANVRYENMIYFAVVPAMLLIAKQLRWSDIKPYRLLYSLTPLFLVPRFWQSWISLGNYETKPGVDLFSLEHVFNHLQDLASGIAKFDFFLPYNPVLNLIGVLGVASFIVFFKRNCFEKTSRRTVFFIGCCVTINASIFLAHHMGIFTHPTQARFFAILVTFVSIFAVVWIKDLFGTRTNFLVASCALAYLIYVPVAAESKFTNTLVIIRQTKEVYDFFERHPDNRVLIVSGHSNYFTVLDKGAIGFDRFAVSRQKFMSDLEKRLVQNIYFIQSIKLPEIIPSDEHVVDPSIELEVMEEFQITPEEMIRISRVANYDRSRSEPSSSL